MALPTETVYGLGADATSADAVARIFAAKQRPADNPLIVHIASADQLDRVAARVTPLAARLATAWWPGPLTLVLEARDDLPRVTTGGLPTVAVRVPDHPIATRLLELAGVPVAAPSANRSGRPSPTTAAHVLADLGGVIDAVVDGGRCEVGVESTVVDARGDVPIVLREGAVTREDLGLGATPGPAVAHAGASPGTRYHHYRPTCRVVLAPADQLDDVATRVAAEGDRVGVVTSGDVAVTTPVVARFTNAGDLAAKLFGALRDAEDAGLDTVVVETVDDTGIGRAVMDRLRRAAGQPAGAAPPEAP